MWKLCVMTLAFISNLLCMNAAPTVIFCLYDLGDTNALKPVIDKLQKKYNVPCKIIAFNKAEDACSNNEFSSYLIENPDHKSWNITTRQALLNNASLEIIKDAVKDEMPNILVIAGMASAGQAQVLNYFKKQGAYAMAFYDNFDPMENKEYIQDFLNTVEPIDEYLLPFEEGKKGFSNHPKTKNSHLSVLGQPALESWKHTYKTVDRSEMRKSIGIDEQTPMVLFVGGYDDTYEEYFRIFASAMKKLPDIKVFVTPHPSSPRDIEQEIVEKLDAPTIKVFKKKEQDTQKLAPLATVVVTHKSGVGSQVLPNGTPVVYVAPKSYTNAFIEHNAAQVCASQEEVEKAITTIAKNPKKAITSLEAMGIPSKATKSIAERIRDLIKSRTK